MKRRIEKKRCAIQARRVYHNGRRADVVYTYGTRLYPVRCIVEIRIREETVWSYGDGESIAAWDARCRKYKEGKA